MQGHALLNSQLAMLASLIAQLVASLLSARWHWRSSPVVVPGCCQIRQRAASCAAAIQFSCGKPSSQQHPPCGRDKGPRRSQPPRLGQRERECQTSHMSANIKNQMFSRGDVTLCFQGLELLFFFLLVEPRFLIWVLLSFILPLTLSDCKQSQHRLENFLDKVSVVCS